jgi:hypothetical protein
MATVQMIQISKSEWKIVTYKGKVLQFDIHLHNLDAAEQYIKNYVSSFVDWTYEVVPLKEGK